MNPISNRGPLNTPQPVQDEGRLGHLRDRVEDVVQRPFVEGRDGFVAYDRSTGAMVGGREPGAVVRAIDGPTPRNHPTLEMLGHGLKGVPVRFYVSGQKLDADTQSGDRGAADAPLGSLSGVGQGLNPQLGGMVDLTVQADRAGSTQVHLLALPADYDGPIFISDIDDTLRPTKNAELLTGKTQRPIFGVPELMQGISGLGVPIVYLSAGSERLHLANEAFLSQLPRGVLLDRDHMGFGDLNPSDRVQAERQGQYKASVIQALQKAYPKAKLFGIGDDKYGDALAYESMGMTAYIHNVRASQSNVPSSLQGVITDDYTPEFRTRVLADLQAAIARSVSFGGTHQAPTPPPPTDPDPPPVASQSFGDRLKQELKLTKGLKAEVVQAIQRRLQNSRAALAFARSSSDADLAQMPASALAVVADELLQAHGRNPDPVACSRQFLRVLTSHGRDAGHVDDILSRVQNGARAGDRLQGDARMQFVALQHANQAVPGDWNGLQAYLDAATGTREQGGTLVEPLIDGSTAFPAMQDAIDRATSSVDMTVFAFQSDQAGWDFARHLAAAADRGCKVRLLYDPVGSGKSNHAPTDPQIYDFLRQHGVETIAQQPGTLATHLTHRKILVVDGQTGFIGGMNVGDEYRDVWHDCHSRVTGPAVRDLQHLFVTQWIEDGGSLADGEKAALFPTLQPVDGGSAARIIGHRGLGDRFMKLAYLRAIDTAQKTINIADPYFSDEDVISHLEAAARRGVQVQIVLPRANNHALEQDAERSFYPQLLAAGVHIFEYSGRPMAHDKVATFDGVLSTIGSSNLDARSLVDNDEANVWTRDPQVASKLDSDLFAKDITQSTRITEYKPRKADDVAHKIAPQL